MATLSIRIDLDGGGRIGPGKVRLMKAIAQTGSISAAGRSLGISYRRAWTLVSELNSLFAEPMVEASAGGPQGGGAALTELGRRVVRVYEEVTAAAETIAHPLLEQLPRPVGESGSG